MDFNAYFRQNAKLVKMAGGHLYLCAKHPKPPLDSDSMDIKSGAEAPLDI
jgi:hypothetical protein